MRTARRGVFLIALAVWVSPSIAQDEAQSLSSSFRKAAKKVLPAVVTIRGFGGVPPINVPLGQPYPGRDGIPDSGGSGVIIDAAKGYVLTNDHVIPDSPRLVVILPNGRKRNVKDVRRDPRSDLALLVIEPEGLSQAEWGDSEALELADWVLAIGQPFGLAGSISAGLVSSERRGFGPLGYDDLIQTGAAINPGSSGGPLVDMTGRIVGINVAIKTVSGGYEGVGFAVPSSRARRVAADLAEFGKVRRGYLGVTTEPLDPDRPVRNDAISGVVVSAIVAESPADLAGLKLGDVLVKVGSRPSPTPGAVRIAVEFAPIGESLVLSIVREGKPMEIVAKPSAAPEDSRPKERRALQGP